MTHEQSVLVVAEDAGPAMYLKEILDWLPAQILVCAQGPALVALQSVAGQSVALEEGFDRASVLLTGTCLGDGLDKQALRMAKMKRIPTVSVVEHWTWIGDRFRLGDGTSILPDFIFLNDELAFKLALVAGLPRRRLVIVGNPILERSELLRSDGLKRLDASDPVSIAFISEDLRANQEAGLLPEMGYDEFQVLEALTRAIPPGAQLNIKLHPRERQDKYKRFFPKLSILDNQGVAGILANSHVAVGMESMFLLELALAGLPTLSYLGTSSRMFIGCELGLTQQIHDTTHLQTSLSELVQSVPLRSETFIGSRLRIVKTLSDLLQTVP